MGAHKFQWKFSHIRSYPQCFLLLQEPVKTQDPVLGVTSLVLSSFVINYLSINESNDIISEDLSQLLNPVTLG